MGTTTFKLRNRRAYVEFFAENDTIVQKKTKKQKQKPKKTERWAFCSSEGGIEYFIRTQSTNILVTVTKLQLK